MALVDVTELLTDPDFVDEIKLISRTATVNSRGENILSETTINSVGSVQPIGAKTLMRLPEALRVENISTFWFKGEITATAPGKYASILVFRGKRYQVQTVFDWSNWGAGWCEGTCVAELPS